MAFHKAYLQGKILGSTAPHAKASCVWLKYFHRSPWHRVWLSP